MRFALITMLILRMLRNKVSSFQTSGRFPCQRVFQGTLSSANVSNDANTRKKELKQQELMSAARLSVAPMMEYTDRHFRHLVRLISKRTLLYTEMVTANAISHERSSMEEEFRKVIPQANNDEVRRGYDDHHLRRYLSQGKSEPLEGPSVLQIGGSGVEQMYLAAQTVMDMTERNICDYTAINLNCGCPSPKVAGKGCFGAALMDDPKLVSELTKAIHDGCEGQLPVTVKCRIGTDTDHPFNKLRYKDIDEEIEYAKLCQFIETVASNGIVTDFAVHARIAVLTKTFTPADNRKVPPLKYDFVRRLVKDYPELTFTLNGGIQSISDCQEEFLANPGLKGIMIGRAWAANPWSFAMADSILYDTDTTMAKNRLEIIQEYGKHADAEEAAGDPVKIRRFMTKAITPLFAGETNAKRYRIALDEIAGIPKRLFADGKTLKGQPPLSELILDAALKNLSEEALLRTPEESYAIIKDKENMKSKSSGVIAEWQENRKKMEPSNYERMLKSGI